MLDKLREAWWITDFVRSHLPWKWQPYLSNYLILAAAFFLAGSLFLVLHGFRERPKIEWRIFKSGNPLAIGADRNNGVEKFYVHGIRLEGENVSGHPLHQVYGEVILHRDGRRLPMVIYTEDGAVSADEIEPIPPHAFLSIGGQCGEEGPWEAFDRLMSPEQFLQKFGAFTIEITIDDGAKQSWSFTIDQLRDAIEIYKQQVQAQWLSQYRPTVRRRSVAH